MDMDTFANFPKIKFHGDHHQSDDDSFFSMFHSRARAYSDPKNELREKAVRNATMRRLRINRADTLDSDYQVTAILDKWFIFLSLRT